jgi:hypothetical protein
VAGGWRKLRKEELHYLCCSSSDIWVTKSRRMMRGADHVTHMAKNCGWKTEGKYCWEGTYKVIS